MPLEHGQAWSINHHARNYVPVCDNTHGKEILPNFNSPFHKETK